MKNILTLIKKKVSDAEIENNAGITITLWALSEVPMV